MAAGAQIAPVVDVPLSLFSGMDPELSAPDCPEGISPDNQDMIYTPGNTASRPCLQRLLVNALTGAPIPTIVYQKTYVQQNGVPLNLILDANGQFWVENVLSSPGLATTLPATTPSGLYAQSVSAFGREYIAISDLLHGQGVPLQYDGTYFDRVSMDGPGASPTVADYAQTVAITLVELNSVTGTGTLINGIVEVANVCTITTPAGPPFFPGQSIIVVGATVAGYCGTFIVLSVTATTVSYINSTTGLGPATLGGFVNTAAAHCETAAPHGLNVGDFFTIAGATVPSTAFNPNNGVGAMAFAGDVDTDSTGFIVSWVSGSLFSSALDGQPITINGAQATIGTVTSPTSLVLTGQVTASQTGVAYSAVSLNPAFWQVVEVIDADNILFDVSASTQVVLSAANATGGTLNTGGQSSAGLHQVVCMWLTRQGYLSQPSPPLQFVSAGNSQWKLTKIPIGPANVIARYFAFTGADGDNFFTIPANVILPNPTALKGAPLTVLATVVPDNVSTTAIFDVPDNTLFAALAIDQTGNDLFDQCVLGPCAGFFAYDSRLFPWGEWNKVQTLLAMGFCGGYLSGTLTTPLGWLNTPGSTGGTLVNGGPWAGGMSWQITDDGSGNAKGAVFQSAYLDASGAMILSPSTLYTLRIWAQNPSGAVTGTLQVNLASAVTGFNSTAAIPLSSIPVAGAFVSAVFSLPLPSVIPADLNLTVYEHGAPNTTVVVLSEVELIFTIKPYLDNLARGSYVLNPEAYAQTTGTIGPEDDESPIRCFSLQRNAVLLKTAEGTHTFQANDFEPDQWDVSQLSRSVGSCSLRGGDPGHFGTGDAAEDWDLSFNKNGLYLFAGGEFWKVSQEMQPEIDSLNWAQQQCIVVKNDVNTRRAYMLVPTGVAIAPSLILVMDYRELDTAQQIAASPPVHISLTGKMICSDLTRKWSRWNITANTAEVLVRPGNQRRMTFGGGNGLAPGAAAGFGNLYTLNAAKFTDDDYGQIFPYYTTYFFLNHEMEQMLGVGAHRKLFKKLCMYVAGIGNIYFTPLVDSLQNALPNSSARQLVTNSSSATALTQDLEWTIGVRGERVAFKIQISPLAGTTDVQMQLSKLIVTVTQDPIAVTRSSRL